MKYLPVINLWANGLTTAVLNGQLKLQCGQWIKCGQDTQKSIYIGTNGRSIDAVHGGSDKEVIAKYKMRIEIQKRALKMKAKRDKILELERELQGLHQDFRNCLKK